MKNYFKKLFLLAFPLTILAFCLVTAKAEQICEDVHFTEYGFPLIWLTPGADWNASATDLILEFFDLFVYFVFFAALSATNIFDKLFGQNKLLIAVLLWAAALTVGGYFHAFLSSDPGPNIYFPAQCVQQSYKLHFGFPAGR